MTRWRRTATFGGTAAVVLGLAGLARVVCPGGCQSCETCISAVAPLGGAVLAVGGAAGASALGRKKGAREGKHQGQEPSQSQVLTRVDEEGGAASHGGTEPGLD